MTADRARGALAVLQDADGKFICEVPCGYIVEQTASAHKPRRIQAQRRRRAMLRRRVALTVALLTVAAILAALMPWSGSGAAVDCPICGCQIRLADRAPRIDFPAIVERHDADAEETEGGEDED